MTRRVYQALFLVSIVAFTFLFAKEIKGAANLFPHVDKVAHFGIFFILAVVMDKAFKIPLLVQILLLAGYGAAIEIMQDMLPYRQASVADFIADFAGAASYFAIKLIFHIGAKPNHG
ncbi:MAG: VanZ family protein [Pseudoalteromonas prydzensis]|uniref:VanZ family protein n=1 Tax=Pseudoalteromonas prydzensis TaxID=182141 RepID=A0ABR9FKY5_9GAMM|nr:VanZ family protein [Pseudoalteromonas prydzensis]MBE0457495.1 VanZ family protein [Pseudoalteromonas prydzensis]